MNALKPSPAGPTVTDTRSRAEPSRRYRDLRAHNERHAEHARMLEAQRRTRIERALQAARERRKIDFA